MKLSLRQRLYILKRKILDVKYSEYESDSGNEEGFTNYEEKYSKSEINFSNFRTNPIFQFVTHNGQLDFSALNDAYKQDKDLLSNYLDIPKSNLGYNKNLKYKFLDRADSRHIMMSTIITSHKRDYNTIVEIGGGYGGLCLENWKQFKGNCTIVNIDLFPTLITAAYYLKKNKIPLNVVTTENPTIKNRSVNLISANDFKIIVKKIKKCDLIFNSRSLCEMDRKTVSSYFDFINSCNVDYFYHENSNFLLFPNSKRHIELMSDDFPVNSKKFKLQTKYISPFTGGMGRYREYIYKKI